MSALHAFTCFSSVHGCFAVWGSVWTLILVGRDIVWHFTEAGSTSMDASKGDGTQKAGPLGSELGAM
eukprot:871567-Amphidinium_carterae.1